MNFRKYVSSASNMYSENRFNKFVVLVLIGLLISQQVMLNKAFRDHKVFLIPPGLKEKAAVSGSSLDSAYLKPTGVYVANLIYSFTPYTVVGQYNELISYFDSESYASYSSDLLKQAAEYRDNDVAKHYQILDIQIFPEFIEMKGDVTKYIASEKVEAKRTTLKISYSVDNGLFKIKSIEEQK